MKSYTDIEQSKKLAEILSIESADMWYGNEDTYKIAVGKWKDNEHDEDDIPCWSLAALLKIIPKCIGDYNIFRMDINDIDTSMWYDKIGYGVCNEFLYQRRKIRKNIRNIRGIIWHV